MADKNKVGQTHVQSTVSLSAQTIDSFPLEVVTLLDIFARIEARCQKKLHAADKEVA